MRFGSAVRLELHGQFLAGLLAGELDGGSGLVIGVEKDHRHGSLRIEPVQLESAVAGVEPGSFPPRWVGIFGFEAGEHRGRLDRLAVRADQAAPYGFSEAELSDELAGRVAGLNLIGNDVVRVVLRLPPGRPCQSSRIPISSRM